MRRFLFVCAIALSGCSTVQPIDFTPVKDVRVNIDARLLQDCGDLPEIKKPVEEISEGDLQVNFGEILEWGVACRNRHSALVGEVRKAFNLEEPK